MQVFPAKIQEGEILENQLTLTEYNLSHGIFKLYNVLIHI